MGEFSLDEVGRNLEYNDKLAKQNPEKYKEFHDEYMYSDPNDFEETKKLYEFYGLQYSLSLWVVQQMEFAEADKAEKKRNMIKIALTQVTPGQYDIILANTSNKKYTTVKMLNGAFQPVDDDLLETNKVFKDLGEVPANSMTKISATDDNELDMVVWFNLDFYENEEAKPDMYKFTIPRYFNYDKDAVAFVSEGNKGIVINLEPRFDDRTIDEWMQQNDTNGKYTRYDEGEVR